MMFSLIMILQTYELRLDGYLNCVEAAYTLDSRTSRLCRNCRFVGSLFTKQSGTHP